MDASYNEVAALVVIPMLNPTGFTQLRVLIVFSLE